MKLKLFIAILLIITLISVLYFLRPVGDKGYEVTETKYIRSFHHIQFRIEYRDFYFPNSEYYAYVYVDNVEKAIGFIKLKELYNQEGNGNPDPDFEELFYSSTMQCYKFFGNLLIYWCDGNYGFVNMNETIDLNIERFSRFVSVAEILVNATNDTTLKMYCVRFLNS